jgi:hypothetical protein
MDLRVGDLVQPSIKSGYGTYPSIVYGVGEQGIRRKDKQAPAIVVETRYTGQSYS